jgi:uncharacterized membrane protein
MTKSQRQSQIRERIALAAVASALSVASIFTISTKANTYAIASNETNGMHYKYVTEYSQKATYIGSGNFVDENGNEWKIQNGEYKKGKSYTLIMHDNGTENIITDDVIVDIY